MSSADSKSGAWTPITEEDKEMVRRQMNRLLATSHFNNSRRYPLLFRFIVEETLEGRGEFLKERLLGIRVFERPADYDTAEDPVVRVTIAEIRKRIAQYYHEEAHDSEMRIELLPGHYVPEFRLSKEAGSDHLHASGREPLSEDEQTTETATLHAQSQTTTVSSVRSDRKPSFSHPVRYILGSVIALLMMLGAGLLWKWTHPSALDELWGPLLADRRTVIFCLPVGSHSGIMTGTAAGILIPEQDSTPDHAKTPVPPAPDAPINSTFLAHEVLEENVVFSDVLATQRISNYIARHNRESNLRPNWVTTLDDLRQGPVILVGGLDNQWTLRALAPLRYRFAGTNHEQYWIMDTKNPAMKDWGLDPKVPLSDVKRDYAIIARIHDESTGQVEMIVAGIGMSGTAAAGEFLVDPRQIEELRRQVGSGFRDHDFEAVLSTDVVNGIAGSPRILTVAVW
jgi:hypothetical protein